MADHDGAIPSDLWRVLSGIQGEAQQAAEGDRACETPEKCWERIEKVLPPEISKAVNMHDRLLVALQGLDEASELIRHAWDQEDAYRIFEQAQQNARALLTEAEQQP